MVEKAIPKSLTGTRRVGLDVGSITVNRVAITPLVVSLEKREQVDGKDYVVLDLLISDPPGPIFEDSLGRDATVRVSAMASSSDSLEPLATEYGGMVFSGRITERYIIVGAGNEAQIERVKISK